MAKILVVDDERLIRKLVSRLLSNDHDVITAADGQEGLDVLIENPDTKVIFLDYNMPVMNGYQFSQTLRNDIKYKEISRIPIVGFGDFPTKKREYLSDFKPKPLNKTEFEKLIEWYSAF